MQLVQKKLQKNHTILEIAETLEESVKTIERIVASYAIEKCGGF